MNKYIPQFLNLIFQQANVVAVGNLSNREFRDLQSLLYAHNSLRIFPPQGRMNFRLTVLAEISKSILCLESDVHHT